MTTFVSESGFLNLSYPASWGLLVDEDDVVFIANSEGAIERWSTGQLEAGDVGVSMVLMPSALLEVLGVSVGSSAGALQFVLAAPLFDITDPENTQIGDIGAVELGSGYDTSQFSLSNTTLGGSVFAIIPSDGAIVYVTAVGSTDEYASAEDLILSILGTIEYSGTADDVWGEVLFYPLPA